ncbi:hypothetical protein [Neobacillus mesonae]|nr:hypothetical protein [Neobacillus mesonae]
MEQNKASEPENCLIGEFFGVRPSIRSKELSHSPAVLFMLGF